MKKPANNTFTRRKFIANAAMYAGAATLFVADTTFAKGVWRTPQQYTVQQVMDLILKEGHLSPIARNG